MKYYCILFTQSHIPCILVLALFCVKGILGRPDGAIYDACVGEMKPLHGVLGGQETPIPYKLTLDKTIVMPQDEVTMTISGESDTDMFRGFLIVVQNSTDENTILGTWKDGGNGNTHTVDCSQNYDVNVTGMGATHKDGRVDKSSVKVIWVAPNITGVFEIFFTVVKERPTYWNKKQTPGSEFIEVTMDMNMTSTSSATTTEKVSLVYIMYIIANWKNSKP